MECLIKASVFIINKDILLKTPFLHLILRLRPSFTNHCDCKSSFQLLYLFTFSNEHLVYKQFSKECFPLEGGGGN